MTRKDYVMLAECINDARLANPETRGAVADVANRIARELARDNPRFDRERFDRACGLSE
jgi:hypothetical protein